MILIGSACHTIGVVVAWFEASAGLNTVVLTYAFVVSVHTAVMFVLFCAALRAALRAARSVAHISYCCQLMTQCNWCEFSVDGVSSQDEGEDIFPFFNRSKYESNAKNTSMSTSRCSYHACTDTRQKDTARRALSARMHNSTK